MAGTISEDLRRSIIRAWQRMDLTTVELAEIFGVGAATITRLKRVFRETGTVDPKPRAGGARAIIGKAEARFVEALVKRQPDWSEELFAKALADEYGIVASAVTVGRAIRRLGYSVKKRRSSPRSETDPRSSSDDESTSKRSKTSPPRVWFLWTKPARTRR